MKLITAIIKSFKIDDVQNSLNEIGIFHFNVIEIKSYGRSRHINESLDMHSRFKIEIAVKNDMVELILETIRLAAMTSKNGDGKIFIVDLENIIRIRTGETGEDIL